MIKSSHLILYACLVVFVIYSLISKIKRYSAERADTITENNELIRKFNNNNQVLKEERRLSNERKQSMRNSFMRPPQNRTKLEFTNKRAYSHSNARTKNNSNK
jgi:hypothetical protein